MARKTELRIKKERGNWERERVVLCAQALELESKGGDIGILQAIIAASAVPAQTVSPIPGFSGTSFASLLTLAQGDSVTSDISDFRFRDPHDPLVCICILHSATTKGRGICAISRASGRAAGATSRRNQALDLLSSELLFIGPLQNSRTMDRGEKGPPS